MSPRMSVSMTLDAVRARVKTQTRRHVDSWKTLAVGDRLTLIEKGMGLPKGAKQVVVTEVEIAAVDVVPLWPISWSDIQAEGLWDQAARSENCYLVTGRAGDPSPAEWFCRFWLHGHGYPADADPKTVQVRRIEWRYLDDEEPTR